MNRLAVCLTLPLLGLALALDSYPSVPVLSAPTYYLVVRADRCTAQEVRVRGASNLPSGSIIGLGVSDFDGDGWKEFSDTVYSTLNDKGLFTVTIHPKKGFTFKRNLVVLARFSPNDPPQAKQVACLPLEGAVRVWGNSKIHS